MSFRTCALNLQQINSLTKYPSIPTYHQMGERGKLLDQDPMIPNGPVYITEKIDGTNGRIILLDDEYLIGSREELLRYSGDLLSSDSQRVVECLEPIARELECCPGYMMTFWFEVFGPKIQQGQKVYGDQLRCRLLDVAWISPKQLDEMHSWDPAQCAAWRDRDIKRFWSPKDIGVFADDQQLALPPNLGESDFFSTAPDIKATQFWLDMTIRQSLLGPGMAEGVVIRTEDRSFIAKLRYEDYRRSTQ